MAAEEQEIDWIYFELNGCPCRINREDSYDLQKWFVKSGDQMLKNPYWKPIGISKDVNCYYQCRIAKKDYKHHRIVYFAHNPEWNIYDNSHYNQIDHKDGDPSNNHISNLRVVTNAENQQNKKRKGYCFCKQNNKWRCYINLNYKQKHLGFFSTEEEAKQAYINAKKKYHPFYNHES